MAEKFVWMKRGEEPPKQVSTEGDDIAQHMWQGYAQCEAPESSTKKEK